MTLSSTVTWPERVEWFTMMTPSPIWQSWPTWIDIIIRLPSPTRVTPPPPTVPGLRVAYSRMRLRAPMISSVRSPWYFRSWGAEPMEAKGQISVPAPIEVTPCTTTWLCRITPSARTTSGPTTQ